MLNARHIIFSEDCRARSKEVTLAAHEVSEIALLEVVLRSNLLSILEKFSSFALSTL